MKLVGATFGGAAPIAGGIFVHGIDQFVTGIRTAVTSHHHYSGTEVILQEAGMSPNAAAFTNDLIITAATAGGSATAMNAFSKTAQFARFESRMAQEYFLSKKNIAYTKSNLQLGQQKHRIFKAGEVGLKEFRLPSGKRIDFLDPANGIIYELKPNNPRAIRMGQKQLETYLEEIKTIPRYQGVDWKTVLETY